MLVTIYCVIGLITFVLGLMTGPKILEEYPESTFMTVSVFVFAFFAGVLWPITIIYGACHLDDSNKM